jgi:hypothetical protein
MISARLIRSEGSANLPRLLRPNDARLIASAPDLLEALINVELCCGQGDTGGARQIARKAIAKATGQ